MNLSISPKEATQAFDINQKEPKEKKDLVKVAQEFEAVFLDTVLKSMRQSVEKSGFMDGGHAEGMYQSMLDTEYAKIMSQTNVAGLHKHIVKQLEGLLAYKINS